MSECGAHVGRDAEILLREGLRAVSRRQEALSAGSPDAFGVGRRKKPRGIGPCARFEQPEPGRVGLHRRHRSEHARTRPVPEQAVDSCLRRVKAF